MANKAGKQARLWARLMRFTNITTPPKGVEGNCYIYTGPTNGGWRGTQYGKITVWDPIKKRHTGVSTHKLAHETFKRKIPDGHECGHKCHRSLCWNPDHTRGISKETNTKERVANQRRLKKEATC